MMKYMCGVEYLVGDEVCYSDALCIWMRFVIGEVDE